ncbi:MAG: hypothetical protein ACP5O3_00825 [Candidatus Micrarchaeia archaeon]
MKKGFFSSDAAIASLLVIAIMGLAVFSLRANAISLEQKSREAFLERVAIESADFLLKKCVGEGGIAECSATVHSHELVQDAESAAREEASELSRFFGARVEAWVRPVGAEVVGGGVCVKRLALLEEKEVVLVVCAR